MTTGQYNITEEPWIDVINEKGEVESVGLLELFRRAHEFADFAPVTFHGITLSLHQYLPLRLACGIFTDAYRKSVRDGVRIRDIFKEGKFDFSEEGCVPSYFRKYGKRFDLFDIKHPFLQAGEDDLREWESLGSKIKAFKSKAMDVNPCAPAETARISEVSGIDPDEFRKHIKNSYMGDLYSAIPEGIKGTELLKAIVESYKITPKEWAYLVMYHSSVFSGAGRGCKAALAGSASYAEIIQGKNLFETIILNSQFMIDDGSDSSGPPQWRWNSQTDLYFDEIEMNPLSGLFCPSKVLTGRLGEDGYVTEIIKSPLSFGDRKRDLMDEMRQRWAKDFEPHFVTNRKKYPMIKGKNGAPDERDLAKNMYKVLNAGTEIWLLPAGATQTDILNISDKDLEFTPMAGKNTQFVSKALKSGDMVHVRDFYRICSSKWVYQTSGVVDGVFPADIFMDAEGQHLVRSAVRLIRETGDVLESNLREYLRPNPFSEPGKNNKYPVGTLRANTALSDSMRGYFGLDGSHDGFLYKASVMRDEESRGKLWEETVKAVKEGARAVLKTYFRPDRAILFCRCEDNTIGFINKKGKELYG